MLRCPSCHQTTFSVTTVLQSGTDRFLCRHCGLRAMKSEAGELTAHITASSIAAGFVLLAVFQSSLWPLLGFFLVPVVYVAVSLSFPLLPAANPPLAQWRRRKL
jgi:uncharacterized protein (DUF983 family)